MTQNVAPLIGRSPAVQGIAQRIESAAGSDAPVLICGERGVGKETVARATHSRSARHSKPMLSIPCAGVPDTLLESQMFGHVRASFAGAYRDRPGAVQTAHGGTVFLDEVGEMSDHTQALLLRFLEKGDSRRVGDDQPAQQFDVRVIAATTHNLVDQIAGGSFRQDLYDRLSVFQIALPPLRERFDDIALLVEHFTREFQRDHRVAVPHFTLEALECLQGYRWPGNMREFRDVVERLAITAPGGTVMPEHLPLEIQRTARPTAPVQDSARGIALAPIALGKRSRSVDITPHRPFTALRSSS